MYIIIRSGLAVKANRFFLRTVVYVYIIINYNKRRRRRNVVIVTRNRESNVWTLGAIKLHYSFYKSVKLGHIIYLNNKRYGANLVYIIARYVYTIHLLMCIFFFLYQKCCVVSCSPPLHVYNLIHRGGGCFNFSCVAPAPSTSTPPPPNYRAQGWLDEATSRRPFRDYNNQYLILCTLNACGFSVYR